MAADSRALEVVLQAKDEATKVIRNFADESVAASKGFATAFLGATAAAGAAVTAFGISSVNAYNEATENATKLRTLVMNVKGATEAHVEALQSQADALQKVGVVEGDALVAGQAQLATFQMSKDAIEKLTPAMADMAAHTAGYNATSQDMVTLGNLVGKVMEGNVGALSRYGVSLTDAQAKQIENGNEMQRATVIAEVLKNNFGGVNEALRGTFQGQMTAANNTLGDFKELVGEAITNALLPIIQRFNEWAASMGGPEGMLNALIGKIQALSQWMRDHQLIVYMVAGAIAGPLVVAFTSWAIAAGAAAISTLIALAPVILIGAAIAALIYGIKQLVQNWDKVKEGFSNAGQWISGVIDKFWILLGPIGAVAKAIKEIVQNWDKIKEFGGNAWNKVVNTFGGGRAEGGSVSPGTTYLVGERGPELFVPRVGGNIVPNHQMGGGGGSTTNHFYIQSTDPQAVAYEVASIMGRQGLMVANGQY